MRIKRVNRYYCDYCKKSGCSGGHMKKHEARCTMNPARVCGMCKKLDQAQPNLAELMDALRHAPVYYEPNPELDSTYRIPDSFDDLSGGCPACTLAAIRQLKNLQFDYDYKAHVAEMWRRINGDLYLAEGRGY